MMCLYMFSNYELLEYMKLAIRLRVNQFYLDIIQEEIYLRMEG